MFASTNKIRRSFSELVLLIRLNYGDWEGSLYFANAFVEYWPFRYAGLGAGYRYISVDVTYEPGHKKETYDVDLPGPVFYVTVGF